MDVFDCRVDSYRPHGGAASAPTSGAFLGALAHPGEHLLVVPPDQARACDVCSAAHAVLVVRQVGAAITVTCVRCADVPKEVPA